MLQPLPATPGQIRARPAEQKNSKFICYWLRLACRKGKGAEKHSALLVSIARMGNSTPPSQALVGTFGQRTSQPGDPAELRGPWCLDLPRGLLSAFNAFKVVAPSPLLKPRWANGRPALKPYIQRPSDLNRKKRDMCMFIIRCECGLAIGSAIQDEDSTIVGWLITVIRQRICTKRQRPKTDDEDRNGAKSPKSRAT